MDSSDMRKFKESRGKPCKPPMPKTIVCDYPYIVPKRGKSMKKKIPPPTLPKPKVISRQVVVTNVDKLGPNAGKVVKDIISAVQSQENDEKIFYEQGKMSMADQRRGKHRKVDKLARDYEHGMSVKKAKQRPTKVKGEKRQMGATIGGIVAGFEGLRRDKEVIRQRAEQTKMQLAAERDADIAEIEADVAKREKELHQEKQDHLTEKMEKVLEQELDAKLSTLSEKKENIVEEDFKESVREVEAKAEAEKKKIEEDRQRAEAARRKWYDMRAPVPAGFIYTPLNVQEKKADMDALLTDIGADANRAKRPCPQ